MTNRLLARECVHLADHAIKHSYTLEVRTEGGMDPDFRYSTGPDEMKLCLFCSGKLLAFLRSKEVISHD